MTDGLTAPRLGGFLLRDIVMQRAPARMTGDMNTRRCVRAWPVDGLPRNTKRRKQKMEQERIRVCGGPLQSEKNRIHH